MKAEALVQLAVSDDDEKLQEAFELVQVVNKRSILKNPDRISSSDMLTYPSTDSKANMEEMVLMERQRELMFEGKRWFDLVRRSMRDGDNDYLTQKLANKGLPNSAIVTGNMRATFDAIFLPCYIEEWKVNKNLWMNPAYTYEEKD